MTILGNKFVPEKIVQHWADRMRYRTGMTEPQVLRHWDCLIVTTVFWSGLNKQRVVDEYKAQRQWCKDNFEEGDVIWWRKNGLERTHIIIAFVHRRDAMRFKLVWPGNLIELEKYR